MPIISVDAERLNTLLGRRYEPQVLSDALEEIGCDVEDTIELSRHRCPRCESLVEASLGADGARACGVCGYQAEEPFPAVDQLTVIRLDLLAARPDLFDIGGLARALKGYLGLVTGPIEYAVSASGLTVEVDPALHAPGSLRPFIRCAVLELPEPGLDDDTLAMVMKLQENLHWGVGRARKLASIGVYDLDAISGPIRYETMAPSDRFEPLGCPGQSMSGEEILAAHPKGVAFAQLLRDFERYPVLRDSAGRVLSMPPIINSEETRVRLGSRRLFVDVTGPSEAAVFNSLRVLCCSLVELGAEVKSVEVVDGARRLTTPDLSARSLEVDLDEARRWLGLPLDEESLVTCFERMRLGAAPVEGEGRRFLVTYPSFRSDVRHMVDLFEDLAIGYGYQRIVAAQIPTMTVSAPRPEEELSGLARQVMLGHRFTEIMSLPMTTEADHFTKLRLPVPSRYVRVANPKLQALTVLRSQLLGGVLRALEESRRRPMPIQLFELDNVVALAEPESPPSQVRNGIVERRSLCFAEMGELAGYATGRGILDSLLRELGAGPGRYSATEHQSFIPGRVASVESADGRVRGVIGELHPEVLEAFHLEYPVCVAELSICEIDFGAP